MRVRQLQRKDKDFEKTALHLKRMKKQNKELFDDKYQLRKILPSVDDLMLKYDIKLDNKHDLKLTFR